VRASAAFPFAPAELARRVLLVEKDIFVFSCGGFRFNLPTHDTNYDFF
jgi:hypothetical protein